MTERPRSIDREEVEERQIEPKVPDSPQSPEPEKEEC